MEKSDHDCKKLKAFSFVPKCLHERAIIDALNENTSALDFTYDEFGFKVSNLKDKTWSVNEEEVNAEKEWLKFLEYSYSTNLIAPFDWKNIRPYFDPDEEGTSYDKISQLVIHSGIPNSLRGEIWIRLTTALLDSRNISKSVGGAVIDMGISIDDSNYFSRQVEEDLIDVLPLNACFDTHSKGTRVLRRVVRALIRHYYPTRIFYHPNLTQVAAYVVLIVGEEQRAYRLLRYITERLLTPFHFCPYLNFPHHSRDNALLLPGIQADSDVLIHLVRLHLPDLHLLITLRSLDIGSIIRPWFSTMYTGHFGIRALLRTWDLLFLRGSILLFQIAISILHRQYQVLKGLENKEDMRDSLTEAIFCIKTPADVDSLLASSIAEAISPDLVTTLRQRYLDMRLIELGYFAGSAPNKLV